MKRSRRALALLLILTTLLTAFSAPAFAGRSGYATLKTGVWYKLGSSSDSYPVYRLELTADSIVTLKWKGNKNTYLGLQIYDNKACDYDIYNPDEIEPGNGSDLIILPKGNYYFEMYAWGTRKPTGSIKVTVKKAINKSNYCRAKALTLKPNTKVTIAQSPNYCYDRWYKITLSKKKDITVTTNDGRAEDIVIYNSKMRVLNLATGSKKLITEDMVPKGTYFIRVLAPRSTYEMESDGLGRCITLKWY